MSEIKYFIQIKKENNLENMQLKVNITVLYDIYFFKLALELKFLLIEM